MNEDLKENIKRPGSISDGKPTRTSHTPRKKFTNLLMGKTPLKAREDRQKKKRKA